MTGVSLSTPRARFAWQTWYFLHLHGRQRKLGDILGGTAEVSLATSRQTMMITYATIVNKGDCFLNDREGNAWTAQFNHAFVDPKCGPQKRVVAVVCPF